MAGPPIGNQNASKGKRWQEAIDKACKQFADKELKVKAGQALDRIAHKVVQAALEGDWWAVTEIGNRLDGKPAQSIDFTDHTPYARELSDSQLLERLERARDAAGTVESPAGPKDASGVH